MNAKVKMYRFNWPKLDSKCESWTMRYAKNDEPASICIGNCREDDKDMELVIPVKALKEFLKKNGI